MKKWLKGGVFALGFVTLLFIIQNQFISNDSWSTWQLPLSGKVIVLDPGHGGVDGGATSKGGTLEKDITLAISLQLRDYLQEAGALVLMTREEDQDLADEDVQRIRQRKVQDLQRRVKLINESNADLFVSLHLNAIASSRWSGSQTFYNRAIPENEPLSRFIQAQLKNNLENTDRFAKPIQNIFILKNAEIPGVLVEAGFLSNPPEAELLNTDDYQEKIAASVYQGIMRYYTNEEAPTE